VLLAVLVGHLPQADHWQDPVAERISQTVTLPDLPQDRAIDRMVSEAAVPPELPGARPRADVVFASQATMTSAILVPVSDAAFGAR
jgi:hypothetical protein